MHKLFKLLLSIILLQAALFAKDKDKREESFPSYKLGFQVVTDAAWLMRNNTTDQNQEIRRARLYLKSKVSKDLSYEIEYSLTSGGKWKDFYLKYSGLLNDITLVAGHIKEPFGLEALTSSKYNTFMERALPDIFISDRKLGVLFSRKQYKKANYGVGASVGIFGPSLNDLDAKDGKYSISARAYKTNYVTKSSFFHIGISAAYNNIGNQKLKLRTRPEAHLADKILKEKIYSADYSLRYGIELAYQYKALSLQSEFVYDYISASNNINYDFSGLYGQMSYFFTDDARRYKIKDGQYGRLKPKDTVDKGGIGAWEGALRISHVNLDTTKTTQYTLGLNWYLLDHMRMMANYIFMDQNQEVAQLRLQYDY